MKRFLLLTTVLLLSAASVGQASPADSEAFTHSSPITERGPEGGFTSDNVEFVKNLIISQDSVGGRVVGKYFYANDQNKIMIFDISDPLNPVMTDFHPLPQEFLFSREDLDTNGKILVMPNLGDFYVFDVEDKANIELLGTANGGQHTQSCLLDCKWAWGSDGAIHDITDPSAPKYLDKQWGSGLPATGGHDVEEVAPGRVLTATQPMMLLDGSDPVNPTLLAAGSNSDGRFIHSARWPNNGTDKFILAGGETNFRVQCGDNNGAFMVWDASKWQETRSFTMTDEYRMENGMYVDGKPSANAVGCSSHWLEAQPDFKDGGLVAAAFFEHGTRFIQITPEGKIKEVGWFVPFAGSTGATYWVTDRIVYALDYNRGIDILRYRGNTFAGTGGGGGGGNKKLPGPLVRLGVSDMSPRRGKTITFRISLRRCGGHKGSSVKLKQKQGDKFVEIANRDLNAECRASIEMQADWDRETFKAVWPKQDKDHRKGKSEHRVVETH